MKPIIKWAGGKSASLSQLFEHFPKEYNRYIEPFVGGGAVFFSLDEKVSAIINDSNEELIELYKVVRDFPEQLMGELDLLAQKYSEEFYYELRAQSPTEPVLKAARTLFLNKSGFNGLYRLNSKGKFNVPFGKRAKCPTLYEKENMQAVSMRLKNTEIRSEDFETVLAEAKEGDFVYCDPPYEPLSVTSSFNAYTASGFSQKEQERLQEACQKAVQRGVKVAVSNSTAEFILNLYSSWNIQKVSAKRAINSKGDRRGEVQEIIAFGKIESLR